MPIQDNLGANILEKNFKWILVFIYGLEKEKTSLHAAIEDATGQVVGLYFDKEETLNGYYNITHQILSKYGIPYVIKTDKEEQYLNIKRKHPLKLKKILSLNMPMLVNS